MGNKICPKCGKEMVLMNWGMGPMNLLKWVCTCLYIVDYQSVEASELVEVAGE